MKLSDLPEDDRNAIEAIQTSALSLLMTNKMIRPFAVIEANSTNIIVEAEFPFDGEHGDAAKQHFVKMARAASIVYEAERVTLASEAWTLLITGEEDVKRYENWRKQNPKASLGDYDARVEGLVVVTETERGRGSAVLPISRTADNVPYMSLSESEIEIMWVDMGTPSWKDQTRMLDIAMLYVPKEVRDLEIVKTGAAAWLASHGKMQQFNPDQVKAEEEKNRPKAN